MLKDHNAVTPVRLEPAALRSRVKHSTTEPLHSHICFVVLIKVTGKIFLDPIFMPPTLKKWKGHIALGLSVFVHPSVCP